MGKKLATLCGRCKRKLRMPAKYTGRRVACPSCNAMLAVPTEQDVEDALPDRFVCTYLEAEERISDPTLPHPADPTASASGSAEDTLEIMDLTEEHQRHEALSSKNLDELLDLPDIQYSEESGSVDAVPAVDDSGAPAVVRLPDLDDESDHDLGNDSFFGSIEGYQIVGRRLVIHDPNRPFFGQLPALVLALPATQDEPALIDLRQCSGLKMGQVRRLALAVLQALQLGKPCQLLLTDSQRASIGEVKLANLLKLD